MSGKCWICNDCKAKHGLVGAWDSLPEWAQYLVREERARRRIKVVIEIAFSDLCYCDRLKVEQAIGDTEAD
jgi:hypothetical protein